MNRAAATVVASGMNGVDQVALDEAHGVAYVAEFTGGHIQQVNLASGVKTPVVTTGAPRGVLVTGDGRFLYVSTDGGKITRYDLATNTNVRHRERVECSPPSHVGGCRRERHPVSAAESQRHGDEGGPHHNSGDGDRDCRPHVARALQRGGSLSSNQVLIASATTVSSVDLTSSVFSAAGPVFLGIGFVPADAVHLPNGYADTTMDPTYFFQVKDCPFGGTLPLMINWQGARSAGANFYQVFITAPGGAPVEVTTPFTDYLWSVPLNRFEAVATSPVSGAEATIRCALPARSG